MSAGRKSLNLNLKSPKDADDDVEGTPPMTPTPGDATDGKSRRSEPRELEFERKGERPSQVDRGTMFIRFIISGWSVRRKGIFCLGGAV